MQKKLVIVESPAKAKTIEKFLGKDYKVMSSYGHIRDLKTKEFSVDVRNNYEPQYVIPLDKRKLVSELKKASAAAEEVLLASDEDREGEAIAWHLSEALGLQSEKTQRIVFHEITKPAIMHAVTHPRSININLVNAQQARRVLDRIVGFEVSPILWRKVKPALSAGRVQSVAVRLLVEREREIQQFVSEASYRVTAHFLLSDGKTLLKTELNRRLKNREEAREFLQYCLSAEFTVDDITTKPFRKSPAPPFTTSTLQQEAARKLSFSVSQTMIVAQRLYESGYITYMRTDSVNLSDLALGTSRETITKTYGEKYYHFRKYQTKSKGAQEAHEAIRPTDMNAPEIQHGSLQDKRLYDLIYKRTVACQMADAELERTTISIGIEGKKEKFTATGEVIQFDGFLHVYMESVDDDAEKEQENGLLPPVTLHETPGLDGITATERFTQRPPRYTEASLVRRLEELGIGRPSTYAPTIQTIQNREYVVRGDKPGEERTYNILALKDGKVMSEEKTEMVGVDRNKLLPTDIGTVVNDFLMEYFPDVMDYNFTASVEKEFDAIAEGELVWTRAMDKFYRFFHPIVEATAAIKTAHKVGERQVGIDPGSGEPVFVKIGRYGPIAQIGQANPENKKAPKPRFASLIKGQSIETITLEETLKLFDLPRSIGAFEGDGLTVGIGRFGPFVRHQEKFISIPKTLDPYTISEEEAIQLIVEKRAKEAERTIKLFAEDPDLKILKGRFGAYIAYQGVNYRIPKDAAAPTELTLEACLKIIEFSPEKTVKKRNAVKRK
ncbi:MAG: type I DNA topoisomerase [Tannerella sp.]|jgi:DNA topoisomerase-1|nr:type I DNA topoisomerase [Tannerella sp.]